MQASTPSKFVGTPTNTHTHTYAQVCLPLRTVNGGTLCINRIVNQFLNTTGQIINGLSRNNPLDRCRRDDLYGGTTRIRTGNSICCNDRNGRRCDLILYGGDVVVVVVFFLDHDRFHIHVTLLVSIDVL